MLYAECALSGDRDLHPFILTKLGHKPRHAPLLLQTPRGPHILGGHELGDVVLALAFANERGHAGTKLLYVIAIGLQTSFVGDRAVAWNHGVEIQRAEDAIQCLGPFDYAATAVVIDYRARFGHEVTGVDGSQ